MNAVEIYEKAVNSLERSEITLGEFETQIAVLKDVEPVVRCKECKYYRESEIIEGVRFCFRLKHPIEDRPIGYNFSDDDFCSRGERRTDSERKAD